MRILFLIIFSIGYIYANVGIVVDSVGNSTLIRGGEFLKVAQKTKVRVHDTIFTKKGARVKIFFKDNTVVSLGEKTTFEVDSYFYENNNKKSNVKFKVLRGFFKTVTGEISKVAPQRFKLETKNATIGIRGTVFAAQVGDKIDVTICTDGTIVITTDTGSYELSKGGVAKVSKNSIPTISKYTQKQKREIIRKSGWYGSMTQGELKNYIEKNFKEPEKSQLLGAIANIFKKDSSERRKSTQYNLKDADNLGFIDDITINGREFDELPDDIKFYTEDIKGGKVSISGLLESEKKDIPVSELSVAISLDGGDSWRVASGHADWKYSFSPKVGKTYELSLKVVRKTASSSDENSGIEIPHVLNINGFILTLGDDVRIENGKLSGNGTLFIPVLQTISTSARIDVNFDNLEFSNGLVTQGKIEYSDTISLQTSVADISITKLVVSPVVSQNKIEGEVTFKGDFSYLPTINLSSLSTLLPSSFSLIVPVQKQGISILPSHGVKLLLGAGNINISYALGASLPSLDISALNAKLDFGDILKTAVNSGSSLVANLQSVANQAGSYTLDLAKDTKAYLYGKSILLKNLGFSFNMTDKSVHFESGIDFSSYNNLIAKQITNATLSADISPSGFSGNITASASLKPIVLLDRGGVGKDVRVIFGKNTSVGLTLGDSGIDIDFDGFEANVDFGDLLKSSLVDANSVIASLSKVDGSYFLNLPKGAKAYLLGQNIALEGMGFSFDMDTKSIHLDSSVDFSKYDNVIAKKLTNATLSADISPSGFSGKISASANLDPIVILNRGGDGKDVKVIFNSSPSLSISLDGDKPKISFGDIDADVDFGDILRTGKSSTKSIVAKLKSLKDDLDTYKLSIAKDTKAYLLGQNIVLDGMDISFNIDKKSLHLGSSVDFSKYDNVIAKKLTNATLSADISPSGFSGEISAQTDIEPVTILSRGGAGKDVRLIFNNDVRPTFSIEVTGLKSLPKIGVKNIDASIDFGTLIKDAKADLKTTKNDAKSLLSWSINGAKSLVSEKIKLLNLKGNINLGDISAPTIKFNSKVDLSGYGGVFDSVKDASIKDASISKRGFSADVKVSLNDFPIWQQKGVVLHFDKSPTLHIGVQKSGLKLGFSNLSAKLYFGSALDGAIATIGKVEGIAKNAEEAAKEAKQSVSEAKQAILDTSTYDWSLSGAHNLFGSKISLNALMGTLDFSDLSNPKIVLNATADMSNYSAIFKYITSATLQDAQISKSGFIGSVEADIKDIDIWKDKNVKLIFDKDYKPKLNLKLTTSGINVGISHVKAKIDFGDTLDGAVATLKNLKEDVYSWSLSGTRKLIDGVDLSGLKGSINLASLKSPILKLNANISFEKSLGFDISSASLSHAYISRSGFQGDVTAHINDITVWSDKKVKVKFDAQNPPTLGLKVSRDGFDISVKRLSASLDFGDLLDGEVVELRKAVASARDIVKYGKNLATAIKRGKFSWSLDGNHDLIKEGSAKVIVNGIGGEIDLGSLNNPIIDFHANADFSQYLSDFASLGSVTLTNAKISKNGIEWNLALQNAGADFTILDLGTKDEDVRVEISNLNAHVGSSGSGVDSADGKLYFGKLFDGNVEPINLTYSSDGVYTFSTEQVLTYIKGDTTIVFSGISGSVEKQGDGSYKVKFGGDIGVKADVFTKVGIQTLSFTNLEIGSSGMSGDITATFDSKRYVILNNKATLILTKVGLSINSTWDIPFKLTAFDGKVDLSEIFDGTAEAALSYVNSNIHWAFDKTINIGKFEFKGLNGGFDFSATAPYISIGGNFGYTGIDNLSIALSDFKVNKNGVSGTIGLADGSSIEIPGVSGLKITKFDTTFANSAISGNFGLQYNKDNFLGSTTPFELKFSAAVDSGGIESLGISSTALKNLDIPNFATFSFGSVSASPSFNDFWVKLSGMVKPNNSLFSAVSSLEFKNLKISKDGVSIDGAGVDFDVSGASASLGGFGLSIEKLGLGFKQSKFYISTKGTLSLKIAEAGAGIKLYSDGTMDIDSIKVLVNNPAVTFAGELAWYKNDAVYGNGFGTLSPLQLSIAGLFSVKGAFKLGRKNGLYWMAKAQGSLGPSGIPLGPLSIYELGGGAAYNMNIVKQGSGASATYDYVPSGEKNIIIILSSLLGTPDLGFTWHGQLDLNVDSAGQIVMEGSTYILSSKNETPSDRTVSGTITLGMAPASLHISAGANIKYMKIGVEGRTDIMFTGSEKHVFIGTDTKAEGFNVTEPLGNVKVTIFGMGPQGYFMIDTRRLAFGANYSFSKRVELHIIGPNPYLELGFSARGDALIQYNPFFMDLSASADAHLEVGYGDVWSGRLGVGLALKFRAPNPSYARVKTYIDIPVYGNASFTAYFPSRPSSTSSDNIPNLVNHIEPYADQNVSLMPELKVVTTFDSDGSHFDFGDMDPKRRGNINVANNSGTIETSEVLYYESTVQNVILRDMTNNHIIDVQRDQLSSNTIQFIPKFQALTPGHRYKLSGTAKLSKRVKNMMASVSSRDDIYNAVNDTANYIAEHGEVTYEKTFAVKTENFEKIFTVDNENRLKFSEVVDHVYPPNLQQDLLEDTKVIIYYSDIVKNLGANYNLIRNYKIKVTDAKNKPINGEFYYDDSDGVPKSIFRPSKALRAYSFCVDNTTGAIKETFKNSDGEYLNPFNNYRVDGDTSGSSVSTSVPSYIATGNLNNPDLGIFAKTSPSGRYSYFTNSTYNILITDGNKNQVAYFSSFSILYNLGDKESLRRFDAMKDQIKTSLVLRRNIDHPEQFKIVVDPGLSAIGANQGIKTVTKTTWQLENGETQIVSTVNRNRDFTNNTYLDDIHLQGAGVALLSASIEYSVGATNEHLTTFNISDISNGEDYSTAAIEEAQDRARNSSRNTKVIITVPGSGGTSGSSVVPGYQNVGGGYTPNSIGAQTPSVANNPAYQGSHAASSATHVGVEFNLGGRL